MRSRIGNVREVSFVERYGRRTDFSLAKDTRTKHLLYARFAIADYLVADIDRDALIHYSKAEDGDYRSTRTLAAGDTFALTAFPNIALAADAFLRDF